MSDRKKDDQDEVLVSELESAIRTVIKSRKASPSERVAAIGMGVKLLAVKHKINGGDDTGFFDK